MELKSQLEYKNDNERINFIVEYNHRQGYEIRYSTRTETVERTREVPEFETVIEQQEQIITNEQDEPILDDNGEFQYETVEVEVEKPIIIEETYIELIPQYDEEDVTINIIEAWGYTEEEKAEERKEEFLKQFFKIDGYGYFRKQPKGYGSAVESLNTAFNIVTVLGNLPANTLTFYAEPDFTIPEQCTEEWLVENATKNEEMTPSEFGTFYAQFMMAWNMQEHQ